MFASEFEANKAPPYCWGVEHCVKVDFSMYNFALASKRIALFEQLMNKHSVIYVSPFVEKW